MKVVVVRMCPSLSSFQFNWITFVMRKIAPARHFRLPRGQFGCENRKLGLCCECYEGRIIPATQSKGREKDSFS